MTLTFNTITRDEALAAILSGLQTKRARIEATLRDLCSQLKNNSYDALEGAIPPPKPRTFSAAARKRMAVAQRARWAKKKGN